MVRLHDSKPAPPARARIEAVLTSEGSCSEQWVVWGFVGKNRFFRRVAGAQSNRRGGRCWGLLWTRCGVLEEPGPIGEPDRTSFSFAHLLLKVRARIFLFSEAAGGGKSSASALPYSYSTLVNFNVWSMTCFSTSSNVTPPSGMSITSWLLFHFCVASEFVVRMLTGIVSGCSVSASCMIIARLTALLSSRTFPSQWYSLNSSLDVSVGVRCPSL